MYYVYLHKRKGTNKVFYVGKGCVSKHGINRIQSDKNRNIHWHRVVKKDGGYEYEIYAENLSEKQAFYLEKKLISEIGIDNLTNITKGGFGGDTLSNHPNIDLIGKKISEHHQGQKNPNYGKGFYYWWVKKYGKEIADKKLVEYKQKKSESNKGKKKKPSYKLRGNGNPAKRDDVKKKISEYAKNRVRKKVTCEFCGKQFPDTHIKRHQKGKNCIS